MQCGLQILMQFSTLLGVIAGVGSSMPKKFGKDITYTITTWDTNIMLKGTKMYDQSHGSPFDRGSADSYYGRPQNPHKGGSGGPMGFTQIFNLTADELEAYYAGYDYNESFGDKKDWD